MTSLLKTLTATYYKFSSLYKNPTRCLRGMAASDQDAKLAGQHAEMLAMFEKFKWGARAEKDALYFKILALLYEVDSYRGRTTLSIERAILRAPTASVEHFNTRRETNDWHAADFSQRKVRTLWKAKVVCCVAAVESQRKISDSGALLRELNVLEEFVYQELHRPDEALPAWTTLAFVRAAQTRVARQGEGYSYVRDKLLSVAKCLDERAAEIIEKLPKLTERLTTLRQLDKKTKQSESKREELQNTIRGLEDDLVLIRQKHTLILLSFGLDNLQRGFLDSANNACQTARFLFHLHGHTYHRLFNELLMIAIKRARTSRELKNDLLALERELIREILPRLEPKGDLGNSKLYVYGLRELAVIQHACGKSAEMQTTLRRMERIKQLGPQWKSRISLLYARAFYGVWQQVAGDTKNKKPDLLLAAVNQTEMAFKHATGGTKEGIGSHGDAQSLIDYIKVMGSRNLIDTTESLITYGTVQLFLKGYFDAVRNRVESSRAVTEALKAAQAVIKLSGDDNDNPRLLAMGYLVAADAHRELNLIVEARQQLETAKTLEASIQHEYVKDRRKAIEEKIPTTLTLYREECGNVDQAAERVFGWYIGNCEDKSSIYKIAEQLQIGRGRVRAYIEKQGPSSPYYHLL